MVVPYPFGWLKQDKVYEAADRIIDEIIHGLTEDSVKLAREYVDKYSNRG